MVMVAKQHLCDNCFTNVSREVTITSTNEGLFLLSKKAKGLP